MRAAIQFLTILPVPAPNKNGAPWFPLVGALVGLVAAAALQTPMHATLAIVAVIVLTGGLHEDGLADVCDAVRAGRTKERMLEILKDSRIGSYGAIGIVLSILVRWQAMTQITTDTWIKLPVAMGLSRAAMVLLAATTPSAAPGLGEHFRATLPRGTLIWIALQSLALALAAPHFLGWIALAAIVVAMLLTRWWFMRRLGGVTGDCLGFQCQIAEAVALTVLAWR
jgi:adenosylcobinamide-GDP ribazoletransferase